MLKEININEFNEILNLNNCTFLCGNGFSTNFDTDFGNIYDRLYKAHKEVIYNSEYEVTGNKVYKRNFDILKKYLRYKTEEEIFKIFEDAVKFAESILNNKMLIDKLESEGELKELRFKVKQIDILTQIYEIGKNKGFKYVNIENWTLLVYFYYLVKNIDITLYRLPKENSFIELLKVGEKYTDEINENIYLKFILNGFNTYYRFLFLTAIFSKGKVFDINALDKIENLKIIDIRNFLNKFNTIMTLNYDDIIENIIEKEIIHLHGKYIKNKKEFTNYQSLGFNYGINQYVSFSDILIGDYFTLKTILPVINNFTKSKINKGNEYIDNIIEYNKNNIKEKQINIYVIFGMNIENDYHILNNIMYGMYFSNINNPKIIYCYFSENEMNNFKEQYNKIVNSFAAEAREYVRNIELICMSTKEILSEYFEK